MNDAKGLFDMMHNNLEHAQKHFESGYFPDVDYYLARLSFNIRAVQKLYGRKPAKSAESSKGENHEL